MVKEKFKGEPVQMLSSTRKAPGYEMEYILVTSIHHPITVMSLFYQLGVFPFHQQQTSVSCTWF